MGYLRPNFPKMTSSSEKHRKIVGKASGIFGKSSGSVGKARRKKEGGVDGARQERKREEWVGWLMTSSKKIKN